MPSNRRGTNISVTRSGAYKMFAFGASGGKSSESSESSFNASAVENKQMIASYNVSLSHSRAWMY
jgi:hypothetical protein